MIYSKEEKKAMAEKNKHIPTQTIRTDIQDTEREIEDLEREVKGLRIIDDRLSNYRADAKESFIKERKDFIERLWIILEVRGETYDGPKFILEPIQK